MTRFKFQSLDLKNSKITQNLFPLDDERPDKADGDNGLPLGVNLGKLSASQGFFPPIGGFIDFIADAAVAVARPTPIKVRLNSTSFPSSDTPATDTLGRGLEIFRAEDRKAEDGIDLTLTTDGQRFISGPKFVLGSRGDDTVDVILGAVPRLFAPLDLRVGRGDDEVSISLDYFGGSDVTGFAFSSPVDVDTGAGDDVVELRNVILQTDQNIGGRCFFGPDRNVTNVDAGRGDDEVTLDIVVDAIDLADIIDTYDQTSLGIVHNIKTGAGGDTVDVHVGNDAGFRHVSVDMRGAAPADAVNHATFTFDETSVFGTVDVTGGISRSDVAFDLSFGNKTLLVFEEVGERREAFLQDIATTGEEAQAIRGVDTLANAVKVTLGPQSDQVLFKYDAIFVPDGIGIADIDGGADEDTLVIDIDYLIDDPVIGPQVAVKGGEGDDTIVSSVLNTGGATGLESLVEVTGGAGADTFIFDPTAVFGTITDFEDGTDSLLVNRARSIEDITFLDDTFTDDQVAVIGSSGETLMVIRLKDGVGEITLDDFTVISGDATADLTGLG